MAAPQQLPHLVDANAFLKGLDLEELNLRPFEMPMISGVIVRENPDSFYFPQYRMSIDEAGNEQQFVVTPQPDSVAILLFHRKAKVFLVSRQFRHAVFVSRVLQRNNGNPLELIKWNDEKRELGCTLELCSGHVEKKDFDDTAIAVIEEKFGLQIWPHDLHHISTFLTGVANSGAACHLYYAEIDHAIPMSGGKVQRVSIDIGMAEELVKNTKDPMMTTSHYYALLWWFKHQCDRSSPVFQGYQRNVEFDNALFEREKQKGLVTKKWKCEEKKTKEGEQSIITKMIYTVTRDGANSLNARDFISRPDVVSILIYDTDWREFAITKRFRPAALVGRVRALHENKNKSLEKTNFSSFPNSWQYTNEMASGELENGENPEDAVLRVARQVLGYEVPADNLTFISRLLIGSIDGGQSMYVYHAECKQEHRINNWTDIEGDVERGYVSEFKPKNTPPSIHVVQTWIEWNRRSKTPEDLRFTGNMWERGDIPEAEENRRREDAAATEDDEEEEEERTNEDDEMKDGEDNKKEDEEIPVEESPELSKAMKRPSEDDDDRETASTSKKEKL